MDSGWAELLPSFGSSGLLAPPPTAWWELQPLKSTAAPAVRLPRALGVLATAFFEVDPGRCHAGSGSILRYRGHSHGM